MEPEVIHAHLLPVKRVWSDCYNPPRHHSWTSMSLAIFITPEVFILLLWVGHSKSLDHYLGITPKWFSVHKEYSKGYHLWHYPSIRPILITQNQKIQGPENNSGDLNSNIAPISKGNWDAGIWSSGEDAPFHTAVLGWTTNSGSWLHRQQVMVHIASSLPPT